MLGRIREEVWRCLLQCWFDEVEVSCLNTLKEILFFFICALSKGVCQSKVEPSRGRGDFTLHWELLSLLRSEMLSEHEVARAGEWEWGWGCSKPGDWSTWRLRNCWETQGTDTGLAIELTVFSWGSSGGYLEFVAILASSLSRKLKAIVGTVSACKGTVGRGDLFWFLFLLT